jgi:hypothetical protein
MEFDNKSLLASDGAARRGNGVSVRLVTRPDSDFQGIENAQSHKAAKKVLRDGQVLILMDGKQLNILGAEVK